MDDEKLEDLFLDEMDLPDWQREIIDNLTYMKHSGNNLSLYQSPSGRESHFYKLWKESTKDFK